MEPFIHLLEYRVVVCTQCQYAVLPTQVSRHIKDSLKHSLSERQCQLIVQAIQETPSLICSKEELA